MVVTHLSELVVDVGVIERHFFAALKHDKGAVCWYSGRSSQTLHESSPVAMKQGHWHTQGVLTPYIERFILITEKLKTK